MGNLIISAGGEYCHDLVCPCNINRFCSPDIELQVTMVECLFRLTSARERSLLAQKWFKENTFVLNAFCGLRDTEFEVVSQYSVYRYS